MNGGLNSRKAYHDPYANLAAAILESGARHNDTRFLESNWAELLRDMCSLDDDMYGGRIMTATNVRVHKNMSHLRLLDE